jgi:hypothetical protein
MMNLQERIEFIDAMCEAAKQLRLAQAALQRACSQCHAEIYEEVDRMAISARELRLASERLPQTVKGRFDFLPADVPSVGVDRRQGVDRREGIDRRVMDMRKNMFTAVLREVRSGS